MNKIKLGTYQHYKGGKYLVFGIARHSETDEKFVVYVPLYPVDGPQITVRPLDNFFGGVSIDGKKTPRFIHVKS